MHLDAAAPDRRLTDAVSRYVDFSGRSDAPEEMLEAPGHAVTVLIDLDRGWTVEGERHRSFVGGLYARPVRVRHEGSFRGVQFDVEPPAVRAVFGVPARELLQTTVGLDQLLGPDAERWVQRLYDAPDAAARFALLDALLLRRMADAPPSRHPDLDRAWSLLVASGGTLRVDALADAFGASRRTLTTRFADHVGIAPKLAARLIRVEAARRRIGTVPLARLAAEHGFADQAHMSREFRALTGRAPTSFPNLQDPAPRTT
jgi:AraC-like DNA-binding protein